MRNSNLYPISHPQVAGRLVDDQALLVLCEEGRVNVFNAVGTRVWELADGTRTLAAIVETVLAEYNVERARLEADVAAFVELLVARNILELLPAPVTSPLASPPLASPPLAGG